jgi:hypothetical protein
MIQFCSGREGELCLRFGEQLDQVLARFGRVAIELQEFLIMPNIEEDDVASAASSAIVARVACHVLADRDAGRRRKASALV